MPKFTRDSELRELQKDTRTGIYYVRKKLKGKKPLLKSTGATNRTIARKIALEELAAYMANAPLEAKEYTFREIAQRVLALKADKAKATQDLARNRIELHLQPYFGHMPITKITENTWKQYIVHERTKRDRTFADDTKLMMAVMKYAFNERLIDRKVVIRNPDPPREEGRAYTDEEVSRLLKAASTDNMKLQIRIGVTMGMRHGEIASLRWAWIDFENGVIALPVSSEFKTKNRRKRIVPMNLGVAAELKARHAQSDSPCVFPSEKNPQEPIPDFDSQWQRTWERAGVDGVFHWTRHTAVTNMLAAGIPESTVVKITAAGPRVIRAVYRHLKIEKGLEAVNLQLGQGVKNG